MDIESLNIENTIPNDNSLIQDGSLTFALDIGTRSIVGIVGLNKDGVFKVIDYEQQFHPNRSMKDGQIEDITLVAETVHTVKTALEKRCNCTFTAVSIAAAGRTLKTVKAVYEQELDQTEELTQDLINALEYCTVGMAHDAFAIENSETVDAQTFYPVGYSIISSQLDGYKFSNLLGHKGKNVKLEIISAFLPQNVVQSLYTVTRMNNLEIYNLTLEPIAAINVIVPPDIRLLNIAIVDIGAGTSDIAISKNGSIVAYGMITVAGDEITETIMQTYLTDFDTAEKIKMSLCDMPNELSFLDILGNENVMPPQEILEKIQPIVTNLGESIARRILDLNGESPVAVFLVGGGSQIPALTQVISKLLNIAPNRIALGGKQPFKHVELFSEKLQSPEFVTPIGIGVVSSLYKGCDFFAVKVNNKKIMLLDYGNSKVLDALFLSSIKPKNLIGISPKPITYYVNGEKITKRGGSSIPGELYVNGVPASIDSKIKQGDEIAAIPAVDGVSPEIRLRDVLKSVKPFVILFNNEEIKVEPIVKIGDTILNKDYLVQPLDEINTYYINTVNEFFSYMSIDTTNLIVEVNGDVASGDYPIHNGDIVSTKTGHTFSQNKDILDENEKENTQKENAKKENIKEGFLEIENKIIPEKKMDKVLNINLNGKWRTFNLEKGKALMFVDMLNYVDMDPKNPQGNVVLRLNGLNASYTDSLSDGDCVDIGWDMERF